MAIDYDDIINTTHICILKREKNSERLYVELIELKFPFEGLMAELKLMVINNKDVFEMERFVTNGSLSCLLGKFDYCFYLNEAWRYGIEKYNAIDYNAYLAATNEIASKIQIANGSERLKAIEKAKENYCTMRKQWFCNHLKLRRTAYMLAVAYEAYIKDPEILAFSHRRKGWTSPSFKLGDDFAISYPSNFGFGLRSYLYTNIRYKDIDILPFTEWIRNRYIEIAEVIKYSRRHVLDHTSWKIAMDFTAQAYNHSITRPDTFVDEWFIKECREFVKGLEEILWKGKTSTYQIKHSFEQPQIKYEITGFEFIDFKGEKISGALSYIEKISEIKGISDHVDVYINRILECNRKVHPQLQSEIENLKVVIKKIKGQIKEIKPEWTRLKAIIEEYNRIKEELIATEMEKQPNLNDEEYTNLANTIMERRYHGFKKTEKEFAAIDDTYSLLAKDLSKNENWKRNIEGHVEGIEGYFGRAGVGLRG